MTHSPTPPKTAEERVKRVIEIVDRIETSGLRRDVIDCKAKQIVDILELLRTVERETIERCAEVVLRTEWEFNRKTDYGDGWLDGTRRAVNLIRALAREEKEK